MKLLNAEDKPLVTTSSKECKTSVLRVELDFPPAELFPNRAKGTHWGKLYKIRSPSLIGSKLLTGDIT